MQKILLCLLAGAGCRAAAAQSPASASFRRNAVYAELGGKSPTYALNYERTLIQRPRARYSLSIGAGLRPDELSLPLSAGVVWGRGAHHPELNLGATPSVQHYRYWLQPGNRADKVIYLVPSIGYRYQRPAGRLLLAVGLAPKVFIDPPSDNPWNFSTEYRWSGRVAAGWCF